MFIHICVHIYMYIYMRTYIYVYMHVCTGTCGRMCVCIYLYIYEQMVPLPIITAHQHCPSSLSVQHSQSSPHSSILAIYKNYSADFRVCSSDHTRRAIVKPKEKEFSTASTVVMIW